MHAPDIHALFDFNYWGNRQILAAAQEASPEEWIAEPQFTYRGLRGTLVHTLDVEWSWRIRLRGEHPELWDTSLPDDDFPDVASLAKRWAADEIEMRTWLGRISDDELAEIADVGTKDRFPLWFYLVHIVTHSEQQHRDAALILTPQGHAAPDLEFLYYADSL